MVTDNGQNSGVYNVDKVTLRKLHSKQNLLRSLLNNVRNDCLMEFTLVDERDKQERKLVFYF